MICIRTFSTLYVVVVNVTERLRYGMNLDNGTESGQQYGTAAVRNGCGTEPQKQFLERKNQKLSQIIEV